MSFVAIVLLGAALSVDAMSVALANALSGVERPTLFALPFVFGGFQGLMPAIGYAGASLLSHWLNQKYLGMLAGAIFIVLGVLMLKHSFQQEEQLVQSNLSWLVLIVQGIATSIDALAAGAYLQAMAVPLYSVLIVAMTTCLLVGLTLAIATKVRTYLASWGGRIGGAILVLLGVHAIIF